MLKLALFASLLVTSVASADTQADQYVGASALLGASSPTVGPNAMLDVDGASRLGGDGWVHVAVAYGPAGDDQGSGTNVLARVGLQLRWCTGGGWVCGLMGADAGVERGTWVRQGDPTMSEHVRAAIVAPRVGIDAGGDHIRVRVGLEFDYGAWREHTVTNGTAETTNTDSGLNGIELATGVAYQW